MTSLAINKNLFEVFVLLRSTQQGQLEQAQQAFLHCGIRPQDMAVFTKDQRHRISAYIPTEKSAQRFIDLFKKRKIKGLRIRMRPIKKENWNEKWAKGLRAFQLTKYLDVVPSWRTYVKTKRTAIFLRSINAFGTGLHETTRFMAQMIESKKGKFATFLDIGTGTGLLALVASQNGAKKILAIDMDPGCIQAARENFAANRFFKYRLEQEDVFQRRSKERFDFIAANLITHDLIQLKTKIASWVVPCGFLAISGISLQYHRQIHKEFRSLPLRCLRIHKGKQWVAFLYQRILA